MKSKTLLVLGIVLIALVLLSGACSGGYFLGRFVTPLSGGSLPASMSSILEGVTADPNKTADTRAFQAATPNELEKLFSPFWESWNIVHDRYVNQPVDDTALMRGAIRGMIEALGDEHSSYMDPDQAMQASMKLEKDYEGIGAWVDGEAIPLSIISAMPGSPAEKAGLRPGDKVVAIDGEDVSKLDGSLVIKKILGPAGSVVKMTILREGEEGTKPQVFDVDVTRAKINIPSVVGKMLDKKVAYVQVLRFAENTPEELRTTLEELLAQDPTGLIVDVRYDPGGYLETAVDVTSEFIKEGLIVTEKYGDGKTKELKATGDGIATEIPLVVLVNEGSASASEIFAGAIQDYGRGKLVGATTYGKGSVQEWTPLSDDQGIVRVTIAQWLTPKGRLIQEVGIEPDMKIEYTQEDFDAGRDPQLDKAIEILLGGG